MKENEHLASVQQIDVEEIAIERHYPNYEKKVGIALLGKIGIKKINKLSKETQATEEDEERCPLCTRDFEGFGEKPKTVKGSKNLYHPICLKRWVKKKKQCPETHKKIQNILAASVARISQIELGLPLEDDNNKIVIGSKTSLMGGTTPLSKYSSGKKKKKTSFNFLRLNSDSKNPSTKNPNSSPRNGLMSPPKSEVSRGNSKFKISPQSINAIQKRLQENEEIDSDIQKNNELNLQEKRRGFKKMKPKTILESRPEQVEERKRAWKRKRGVTYNELDAQLARNKNNKMEEDVVGASNMNMVKSKMKSERENSFDFEDIYVKRSSSIKKNSNQNVPPRFASPQLERESNEKKWTKGLD